MPRIHRRTYIFERPMPHPFAKLVGLHLEEPREGRCVGVVAVTEALFNPAGVLHGGVMFSLADTCMGAALWSRLEPHETCVTIEIKINYLRAVTTGRVRCDTRLVQRGRSVGVLESDLLNELPGQEPVLAAKALGTFAIMPRKTGARSANLTQEQ